jgi:Amt family ammonium transporter
MSNLTDFDVLLDERLATIEATFAANAAFSDDLTLRAILTGDGAWLLVCASLVFFMQAGFALVESGSCRWASTQSILMKNCMDAICGTVAWTFIGACLAWGDAKPTGGLFGTTGWGNPYDLLPYNKYQFNWAFAATAATITSGGVAERIPMEGYVIFSMYMTAVIYPVVVSWCWNEDGWLREYGYVDYAGAGVVHITGGMSALVGAYMIGPRAGRFGSDRWKFSPHSVPNVMLGTLIMWFGFYGLIPGCSGGMGGAEAGAVAGRAAITTTFGAGSGAMFVYIWTTYIRGQYDICGICNGLIGGLIAVTAGAKTNHLLANLVVGGSGGMMVLWAIDFIQWLHIDDPVGAFAVHFVGGCWGLVMAWAADETGTVRLGPQVVGMISIAVWSAVNSAVVFGLLLRFGTAMASTRDQQRGMDAKFCVEAYMSAQGVSRFKAYIAHNKGDQGSLARWLHLKLGEFVDGKSRIYFDSDNTVNLDSMMDTVRDKIDYFLIVHSPNVYWNPINIGEISQAILSRVPVVVVVPSTPRHGQPLGTGAGAASDKVDLNDIVAQLPEQYQKKQQEIDDLLQPFGIYYKDIEQAYSLLPNAVQVPLDWQSEDQCAKDLSKLGNKAELITTRKPVAMLEKVWESVTSLFLNNECAACQEKAVEKPLLFICDVHDSEAYATVHTITFCMTAMTRENIEKDQEFLVASPDNMQEVDAFIERGCNVVLVLSKDCMRSVLFTRVALHVAKSTVKRVVVPIHIEKLGFVFPGEDDYERIIWQFSATLRKNAFGNHGQMDAGGEGDPFADLSNEDRRQVQILVAFYTFTFRLIALPYSNHASYRTLEQNLAGLNDRLHPSDPDDESAFWLGPVDKLMSNADRRVERAATNASQGGKAPAADKPESP